MPTDLERRLDAAGDRLPLPSPAASSRARRVALAALPVAPAIAPARRRLRLAGAAAVLSVAAAVALALVLTFDGTSPLATEKALAALGHQPVVHALVESERPSATIVDLTTGATALVQKRASTETPYLAVLF